MKRLSLPLLLLLASGLSAMPARAGLVTLSYQGVNGDNSFIRAVGSGSFQFADGASSVSLSSLISFSFTQTATLNDPSLAGSSSYVYSLKDLVSFNATFATSGAVVGLSFRTGFVSASNGFLNPQYFVMSSLRSNAATSYQAGPDGDVTTGTVVATNAVPELTSLNLCALAIFIGGVAGWQRRARTACRAA